ncbi:MAG TPA: hypothetical protein VFS00_33835 [Polyangiaceae bacterium]|nr:hypothetical protein [Polyangiaceae bacterium]
MRLSAGLFTVLAGVAALAAGCAGAGEGASAAAEGGAASARAALTAGDVDLAPECEGIVTYANVASFATLDEFLPSNLAQSIVSARQAAPFTTLKSLSSVSGMGAFRLAQIEHEARADEFVDAACACVYEELALSADDAAALVDWVNAVGVVELEGVLDFLINPTARDSLLAGRPFASARAVADAAGVGVDTFRALRNAAVLRGPFEELASEVTELDRDVALLRYFDWVDVVTEGHYYLSGMTCFGVDPSLLVNGATIRPNLADGAEVLAEVSGTVSYADRYDELTVDPAVGLADLAARVAGGSFFGCYLRYTPDPWSGINRAFFVDQATGFSVFTETRWSE